jgi:hypothetical protein
MLLPLRKYAHSPLASVSMLARSTAESAKDPNRDELVTQAGDDYSAKGRRKVAKESEDRVGFDGVVVVYLRVGYRQLPARTTKGGVVEYMAWKVNQLVHGVDVCDIQSEIDLRTRSFPNGIHRSRVLGILSIAHGGDEMVHSDVRPQRR